MIHPTELEKPKLTQGQTPIMREYRKMMSELGIHINNKGNDF